MPTNMMKIFVPIPMTAYQYIGQSGVLPPPHTTFGTPCNLGGGFMDSQQLHELQNLLHTMSNKG